MTCARAERPRLPSRSRTIRHRLAAADGRERRQGQIRRAARQPRGRGKLVAARTSRTAFEVLKKCKAADAPTWAEPALSGNRVFVKDVDSVALGTID
jgi:hypothetical protein